MEPAKVWCLCTNSLWEGILNEILGIKGTLFAALFYKFCFLVLLFHYTTPDLGSTVYTVPKTVCCSKTKGGY